MTKTWKIGEYCRGGIITVEITGKTIHIIGKEWDRSAGYKKSSNQKNAKEWTRLTVQSDDYGAYSKMNEFLNDLTTSYYADQVMQYIKENCNLLMGH